MTYILDTNVLSEMMKKTPDRTVYSWLGVVTFQALHITTITQTEILYGISSLPRGKRRDDLFARFQLLTEVYFEEHVLQFDAEAALCCADIRVSCKKAGRPIQIADAMIAGIVSSYNATLVSRDSVFEDCGFPVINPWMAK